VGERVTVLVRVIVRLFVLVPVRDRVAVPVPV